MVVVLREMRWTWVGDVGWEDGLNGVGCGRRKIGWESTLARWWGGVGDEVVRGMRVRRRMSVVCILEGVLKVCGFEVLCNCGRGECGLRVGLRSLYRGIYIVYIIANCHSFRRRAAGGRLW